ncbi:MAG: hypothetical protein WCO52_05930 [bacterium]
MKYVVRRAEKNPNDLSQIFELLANHFSKEHKMGSEITANFDREKALRSIIASIDTAAWVAEDENGIIIGSLGLLLNSPWYSHEHRYGDLWFYVLPENREYRLARAFINEVKAFSRESQHPVVLGIFNMDDTERKNKMMERLGMKLAGSFYYFGE